MNRKRIFSRLSVVIVLFVISHAYAQQSPEAVLKGQGFADLVKNPPNLAIEPKDIGTVRDLLWKKYLEMVKNDPVRRKEVDGSSMSFNGKTMRYAATVVKGDASVADKKLPLYIAMHGGGGGPARMNDGQWQHMKRYYLANVKHGIYVAPRGITNTWNLHFVKESYVLYDRLIENMIALKNVDPNKVYILGFSAGGDGAYQIPARMPDRWAAANMSAGHHNGVSPKNLFNVPFLIQVGERDGAYKRNKEAAKYFGKLDALAAERTGWYVHDAFIHKNRPHNFLDNHPAEKKQEVLKSPKAWLGNGDRKSVMKNTSAVRWLSGHTRNPLPKSIFWNLKTGTDRSGTAKDESTLWSTKNKGRQCYWLDLADTSPKKAGCEEVIASYDKATNAVTLQTKPKRMIILLHEKMVDFDKKIVLSIEGKTVEVSVKPSVAVMIRTLMERGDPNYCFAAEVVIGD